MSYIPFPGEFEDTRSEQRYRKEREEVARQVRHLQVVRSRPSLVRTQAVTLNRRRGDADPVQLESLCQDGGPPYVASYEFLVPGDQVEKAGATLTRLGLEPSGRTDGTGRVALGATGGRRRERAAADTFAMADELRKDGLRAELNYVVPLGVVMKGPGGPEPSVLKRNRPDAAPAGPRIAVLDNGVTDEQREDGFLRGLARADGANVDPLDAFPPKGKLDESAGHGTFVTGVVQQVFPAADVAVVKVSDSDGVTTVDRLAEQMVAAVEVGGAKILNLSLGTSTVDDRPPPSLLDAVRRIAQLDPEAVVVAAAGNMGDERKVWPGALARHPGVTNVVAVAGLDPRCSPSTWSTRGDWVTFSAIGEGVVSTYVIGEEDGELIHDPDPDEFEAGSWATWTGTSFATPQVAAAIARCSHEKATTARAALEELLEVAEPVDPKWGRMLQILPGT